MIDALSFSGLDVLLAQLDLRKGQEWASAPEPGLWCSVLLQGTLDVRNERFGSRNYQGGLSFSRYSEAVEEIHHAAPQDCNLLGVFLHVSPSDVRILLGEAQAEDYLRRLTGPNSSQPSAAISALAWHMIGCRLQGPARRLYLSGKALEVLGLMPALDNAGSDSGRDNAMPLRAHEIERAFAARDMLLADLVEPPSIPELAAAVGLNARRLGELFKIQFGTSVYAYLKAVRLDRARLTLESGDVTVAQVAYQYGYQPAHFATEFKRKYGVSPNALLPRRGFLST